MEAAIIQELLKKLEIRLTKESFSLGDQYFDMVTGVEIYWDGEFLMEGEERHE